MLRSIAQLFFRYRSYTPIPLVVALFLLSAADEVYLLAGVGVAAVGEALRIWALRHAGPKTRSHRKIRVDDLVVTGPYSLIRNPLYIGNFVISVGVCIASGQPLLIFPLVVVFGIQYSLIIRAEEEFLEQAIGEAYRKYRESVPRLIPHFHGYRSGDHRFPLREILPRELNTIAAIETVLALVGLPILFPGLSAYLPMLPGS
ncbi:MAG: isoprenylcysteine carboxylmethyltransferase family protein [Planctomycetota bacterium]|nr:isoprenylcysteine carboxylmethyltransferase family protein [Planctomycetota bacterium]